MSGQANVRSERFERQWEERNVDNAYKKKIVQVSIDKVLLS